jgi:hypothetical protein
MFGGGALRRNDFPAWLNGCKSLSKWGLIRRLTGTGNISVWCVLLRCVPAAGERRLWKLTGITSDGWPDPCGLPVLIAVRRFVCRHSPVTVSCLPQFAQPYRLVCNETIEAFFAGNLLELTHILELCRSDLTQCTKNILHSLRKIVRLQKN